MQTLFFQPHNNEEIPMTQTSRAVRIHAPGGPEQLVIDTVERKVARSIPVGKSPHGVWTLKHAKR